MSAKGSEAGKDAKPVEGVLLSWPLLYQVKLLKLMGWLPGSHVRTAFQDSSSKERKGDGSTNSYFLWIERCQLPIRC